MWALNIFSSAWKVPFRYSSVTKGARPSAAHPACWACSRIEHGKAESLQCSFCRSSLHPCWSCGANMQKIPSSLLFWIFFLFSAYVLVHVCGSRGGGWRLVCALPAFTVPSKQPWGHPKRSKWHYSSLLSRVLCLTEDNTHIFTLSLHCLRSFL